MKTQRQQVAMLHESLHSLSEFVADTLNQHSDTPAVQEGMERISKHLGYLHISLTADDTGRLNLLSIGCTANGGEFAGITPKSREFQRVIRDPKSLEITDTQKDVYDGADLAKSFTMVNVILGGEGESEGASGPKD